MADDYFLRLFFEQKKMNFNNKFYDLEIAHLHFYDDKEEESIFFYVKRDNITGEIDRSFSFGKDKLEILLDVYESYVPIKDKESLIFKENKNSILEAMTTFDKAKIIQALNIESLIPYII